MQLTWTTLLAQYGQQHNGLFFGGNDDRFDGQLILNRGEKSPLLVMLRQVQSGRYASNQLTARTSVRLSGDYTLDIRPKGLSGSGYQTIMALAGQSRDYGCPEATKGRIITASDRPFTKQILSYPELRQALARQTGEQLRVCPDARGEGWHLVEVDRKDFDSGLNDGPWPRDAILNDSPYHTDADRAVLFRAAQAQFDKAMDNFLDLLTAAGDALAVWSGVISGR
mgnify:CR=1 FL=1